MLQALTDCNSDFVYRKKASELRFFSRLKKIYIFMVSKLLDPLFFIQSRNFSKNKNLPVIKEVFPRQKFFRNQENFLKQRFFIKEIFHK